MFKYFITAILALAYNTAQATKNKANTSIVDQVKEAAQNEHLDCERNDPIEVQAITTGRKSFYIASCLTSVYNYSSILFALDSNKNPIAVPLAAPILNQVNQDSPIEIEGWIGAIVAFGELSYNSKQKVFILFAKARGNGDSGEITTYTVKDNGDVVLTKYELDTTENEEFDPVTLFPKR